MSTSIKYCSDNVHPVALPPPQVGEILEDPAVAHDAVFGDITIDGPNYRDVGWKGTVVLMMKTQIGLGVLSIPFIFDTLGVIPGVILLVMIAGITTWSDYMVGVFKLRHPQVYGIDDARELMFGRIGREIFLVAFWLFFIFCAGSAMLGISIALNAISTHGACTAVFVAVAAIVGFVFASIQTLGRISWLAWVGVASIIVAVLTVTIAVGIQDRPAEAPKEGEWRTDYKLVGNPNFTDTMAAISSLVFAYAGTPAFFSIAAEMRQPRLYTRSLLVSQCLVTMAYVVIGVVVYIYCGSYVSSPALGSAGPTVKKVAYGLSIPGLFVSTTLSIHFPSKLMFVRLLRGSNHLTANSATHWATWFGCVLSVCVIAYLVASGIPVFNGLISLIGALLGTLMAFQPMGCMWLYDNWASGKETPTLKWCLMVAWSCFVVICGSFLMISGTYSSIVGIVESYRVDGGSKVWACADNSGSV